MPPMDNEETRRALIEELSAIWDVEGLEVSSEFKELEEKYISGEISLEEFKQEVFPEKRFNV
jgi:hypothetical protein